MRYDAVLWDCDGCLIDSEWIACGLAAEMLTELGYAISTQEFVKRFCGQSRDHIYSTIQQESGVDYLPLLAERDKSTRQKEAFRKDLTVITGIEDVLNGINVPMAIASGSRMARLEYTLQLTNLYDRFMPHIYHSAQVAKGKPAPDVFLYAAQQLGVMPEKCLVIEDSENGVRAGKAAGMTVIGFTGGKHILDKDAHQQILTELGADHVLHDMRDLPKLMV